MGEDGYGAVGGYSKRYSLDQSEISQNSQTRQNVSSQRQYPKRSFVKMFGVVFGTIIFMGIIFGAIYSLGGFEKKISDNKLIEGATLDLSEDKNVKFKFGEEDHGIAINFVGTDSVELTISSDPIKLNLKINEVQEVDINNDGITDILVKINKISEGNVEVAIRKIETLECLQDWACTNWTFCDNGLQERTCSDNNLCGGDFGKPPEKKKCEEMNNVNWTDNGNWSRERFEERITIEEQKRKLESEKENISEEEYGNRLEDINKSFEEFFEKENNSEIEEQKRNVEELENKTQIEMNKTEYDFSDNSSEEINEAEENESENPLQDDENFR